MTDFSYSMNGRIFSNWKRPTRAELNAASQRLSDIQHVDPNNNECRNDDRSRVTNGSVEQVHGDNIQGIMQGYNGGKEVTLKPTTDMIPSQKKNMILERNIATLQDLKRAFEGFSENSLKEVIEKYFDFIPAKQTEDPCEFSVDLYRLKENLNLNNREIKTIGELLDALTSSIQNSTPKMTRSELNDYLNRFS